MCLSTFLSEFTPLFGAIFTEDLLRYVIGAGGVYLVVNLLLNHWLARRQIRAERPGIKQIGREVLASLRTVLIFSVFGSSIALGAHFGLVPIYFDIADYGVAYLVGSVIAVILAHDAWFYWSHRVMHRPRMFRWFHRLHHRSHNPTAFTAYAFDISEAMIHASFLPLFLALVPMHPLAIFLFTTHMILINALHHSGVEVYPARRDGRPLFGWMATVTHHDLHHGNARWNHGLYFTFWDRMMGTEHPEYLAEFARVAKPLSRPSFVNVKIVVLTFGIGLALVANHARAETVAGRWVTPGVGMVVELKSCAADPQMTCAELAWVWNRNTARHVPVGGLLSDDLVADNGTLVGHLTDPETGRQYRGRMQLVSDGTLHLRGCAGPFCRQMVWHRAEDLQALQSLSRMPW